MTIKTKRELREEMEREKVHADACHAACNDYACVRADRCTGAAGHDYRDAVNAYHAAPDDGTEDKP